MKSIKLIYVLILVSLFSCEKSEVLNDESKLISMKFDFGEVAFDEFTGSINVPENISIGALAPVIEVSEGATVYPGSGTMLDFSTPVTFTVTSEDKESQSYYTISMNLPIAKFVIFDCSNCTQENPTPEIVINAKIDLYKESNQQKIKFIELYSDNEGEAMFYGDRMEAYYAVVSKDNASSTKDGYLIKGVAQNEKDVNYYNEYYLPDLKIGDIIYWDLNGDAWLDELDKSDYVYVSYDQDESLRKEIYISE